MRTRRHAKHIANLVLAWFVLSLGAAVAAPLMQSNDFIMVCSGTGMVQLLPGYDDGSETGPTSRQNLKLKCPLCMLMDAPPDLMGASLQLRLFPGASALADDLSTAIVASACAAPLPARGPPSNSTT